MYNLALLFESRSLDQVQEFVFRPELGRASNGPENPTK